MRTRRLRAIVVAIVIVLVALAGSTTGVAAAGDQLQDSAVKTYELDPVKHVIRVTERISLKNKAPSSSRNYDCSYWYNTPYGSYWVKATCARRTNYYYNGWSGWVEKDAQSIKVKGDSGKASIKMGKTDGNWRKYKISYAPLWYGKSRVLTITYTLPAAGPRETGSRIATATYADFCAYGPGADKGEARLVVPEGFRLTGTNGMTGTIAGGKTTYSSGKINQKPWEFEACVTGDNPDGFTASDASTPEGLEVTIAGGTDDPTWNAAAAEGVATAQAVAGVLGVPAEQPAIKVREVRGSGTANASMSGLGDTLSVSERELDPATISDALIRGVWFPASTWPTSWLQSGYQLWAMDQAGVGSIACEPPGAYPGSGDPDFTRWGRVASPTPAELEAWAWKQQAACSIVAQVNEAMGPEGTAAAWTAITEGWDAWSPADAPVQRASDALDWQTWLDIVTERGLVPAGADDSLAADLLLEHGITVDVDQMADRADARAAYTELAAMTGGEPPAFVGDALRAWEYGAVTAAATTASEAWETAARTEAVLAAVPADGGIVRSAVLGASSQADLEAALAQASEQLAAAEDVADAQAALEAPRDAMQQLGLAGSVVPGADAAVAAVAAGDAEAAGASADEIRSAIGGAADAGTQRAAIGGGVVVGLVLLLAVVAFLLRRRSRTHHQFATASAVVGTVPAPVVPPEPAPDASSGWALPAPSGWTSPAPPAASPDPGPPTLPTPPAPPGPPAPPSAPRV